MKSRTQILVGVALSLAVGTAFAATPEIKRDTAPAQKVGVEHTLRVIPEACARLQGQFTGNASSPYAFQVVKSNPNCQPRAKLVDAKTVKPEKNAAWILNDEVRVPSAACTSQVAALKVWRLKAVNQPYKLDAQGRARVYLKDDAQKDWTAKDAKRTTPTYAVALDVTGSCK